ncbi:MAG: tetratricopeptide repeat protein [Bdellovibrionia bacterium]
MKKKYLRLDSSQFVTGAFFFLIIFTGCSSAQLASSQDLPTASPNDSKAKFTPKPTEPPSDLVLSHDSFSDSGLHAGSAKDSPSAASAKHEVADDLRKLITEMSDKIQSLETKLSSMNDKMDAQKFNQSLAAHSNQGKLTEVAELATDNAGIPMEEAAPIPYDPEAGFTQDIAVQTFRKALIIFQGLKLPEATLAFSDFLEKYPDHPMAGAAQFYIAEAYMKQKEYKLALQEYQKILTTYDRSSHLSDTLKQMATAETILKRSEEAARHRQLLTSLFPLSPAASDVEVALETTPVVTPSPILTEVPVAIRSATPPPHSDSAMNVPPTAPLEDKSGNENNLRKPGVK